MAQKGLAWTAACWTMCWTLGLLAQLTLLSAGLGAALPVPALPVHPTASGYYQFVAGSQFSQGSNPYFYPPTPHPGVVGGHAFHGHGQPLYGVGQDVRAPFLSGWDRERDLYSSRYASSALPVALPVHGVPLPALGAVSTGLAFPVGPVGPIRHYEPSQRLFGTRARPAMVPTPYLKFSSHSASGSVDKGKLGGGSPHHNSLVAFPAFPEPGFYGRSGTGGASGQEGVMLHGQGHGYPETTAVGFYGKPT